LDPIPPSTILGFALSILPAVFAAAFAGASWAFGLLSPARRTALRDASEGAPRKALDRYLESGRAIESRWLVVRAFAIGLTALLVQGQLGSRADAGSLVLSALIAVLAYAVPSEAARAVVARNPERAAPWLLTVLRPFELLAAPISAPILAVSRLVGKWAAPAAAPSPEVTETEVEMIVNEGERTGSLGHGASEMIRNVPEFGDATAGQVMLPRTDVTAFDVDTPLDEALRTIVESGHSRYPVYKDSLDNVIGLLYAKDLLRLASDGGLDGASLESIVRTPVAYVPESQLASSVLRDMRAGRHHMAIVIDEFGGMSGIVTLEDLLEQIVGDIRDEHENEEPPIADLGEGRLLVDASVPIGDLSRYLGAELPEDGDYHSLGGLLTAELGRVPEVGTRHTAFGLVFVVREGDERRVSKVEITRVTPAASVSPPSASRVSAA